ncbi:MAG: radical SAM protein, partial [Planctomycetota bacterium]
ESIHDDKPLRETFNESEFLRDFREITASSTRGCVVLERPDLLLELAEKHGARDTTQRKSAFAELEATVPRRSQYVPGSEIPERSWAVRFAKWIAFNDFGAYSKHFTPDDWVDPETLSPPKDSSKVSLPVLSGSVPGDPE